MYNKKCKVVLKVIKEQMNGKSYGVYEVKKIFSPC